MTAPTTARAILPTPRPPRPGDKPKRRDLDPVACYLMSILDGTPEPEAAARYLGVGRKLDRRA